MIHPALIVGLMQKCAPRTDVRTLAAIVSVESGGDAWAVRDPSSPVGVHPATYAQAVTLAHGILVRGGRVALGLSQVLLPRRGLDSATLLGSPCANLRAGSAILAANYREQLRYVFAPDSSSGQQAALRRALSEYNSGSPTGAPEYTQLVLDALATPFVESIVRVADGPRLAVLPMPIPRASLHKATRGASQSRDRAAARVPGRARARRARRARGFRARA